nr:unnamed protein product [Spirometra erinaceieuropaei]
MVSQVFGCLQSTVWNRNGLHPNSKLKTYKAVFPPTLLYGAEAWTVHKEHHCHPSSLQRIPKLRWQDRIPDMDALERTGILSIYTVLRRLQLGWSGYLVRMDDERLTKRLFSGNVARDSRRQGN